MDLNHYEQTPVQPVSMEGARGCRMRWLIAEAQGAPNFAMRQFEVEPGGHTPRHRHPYEHEVFVLEGAGLVYAGDEPHPLRAGDVIYVRPDEVHQFCNPGVQPLKFLCLIPNSASGQPSTLVPKDGC
jgi:quercetin dioxygenase-like cupin family protein